MRRRIWMVQHGLIEVPDKDAELDRLDAQFREMGDRFVETYRAWSQSQ